MKIGVFTLPLHNNFGGNLQAFALMFLLKSLGHDAVFIGRSRNKKGIFRRLLTFVKRFFYKFIMGKRGICLNVKQEERIISVNSKRFIENNILPSCGPFDSSHSLKRGVSDLKFNAIIVGSDQVWRPDYTPNIRDYFLEFADKDVRKISYAASFGKDEWVCNYNDTVKCKELLHDFYRVSVRENTGIDIARNVFDYKESVEHVLDPTLLLDNSVYVNLIDVKDYSEIDLMVYILDETSEKTEVINSIANIKGYEIFRANKNTENWTVDPELRIAPSVSSWLNGFYNSKYVITDSFHACVFSILFNKNFIVYGNGERGLTRFKSFLTLLDLEDRIILSKSDFNEDLLMSEIDWPTVNDKLEKLKTKSLKFLTKALE